MDYGLFSSTTPFTPPTTEDDRLSWLRLIRSRRVGPATFHRLIAEHGSAAAALAALPQIARAAGLEGYEPCPEGVARAEIAAARRARMRMVCWGSPDYPLELADLPDAPPVMWLRGDPSALVAPMVALVGARNASSLGQRMASRLARALGEAGFAVVSGLARGIDAAAHRAALPTGTVAVMAGGADVAYPPENADLLDAIAGAGAVVSEHPPGMAPQARHFPLRNRIISGLALGVVVVEAAERSGSLITARNALDQGREVMAVPGHPVDARAGGCNLLIRDGCTLVRNADDVIEALGPALARAQAARARRTAPLSPGIGEQPQVDPQPSAARHGENAAQSPVPPRRMPPPGTTPGATNPAQARAAPLAQTTAAPPTQAETAPKASPSVGFAPETPVAGRPSLSARALASIPPGPPPRSPQTIRHLHATILDRLGPAPLAEDQLIRDLAIPAAQIAPELLALELDGRIERRPGGLLTRTG